METNKTSEILMSIADMLRHIKEVDGNILKLSNDSADAFVGVLESEGIKMSDVVVTALQYQDIISQQISAVSEAIDLIDDGIQSYLDSLKNGSDALRNSIDGLSMRLATSLSEAQKKSKAFSGNALGAGADEISFFD